MGVLGWFNGVRSYVGYFEHAQCLAHAFLFLRPGVLGRTLSHLWCKLNLPIFLFNVGLLTLMKIYIRPIWDGSSVPTKGLEKNFR